MFSPCWLENKRRTRKSESSHLDHTFESSDNLPSYLSWNNVQESLPVYTLRCRINQTVTFFGVNRTSADFFVDGRLPQTVTLILSISTSLNPRWIDSSYILIAVFYMRNQFSLHCSESGADRLYLASEIQHENHHPALYSEWFCCRRTVETAFD